MHRAATAYIAMGSNLDRPYRQIERALRRIRRWPDMRLLAVSPFYRSKALEPPDAAGEPPQPDYINAVIAVSTRLSPHWLLRRLQALERRHGRVRTRRWGARTLDLDILLYDRRRIETPHLTVPHPELHKRAFVLYPLSDIAPRLHVPGRGPLVQWLRRCETSGIRRLQRSSSGRM